MISDDNAEAIFIANHTLFIICLCCYLSVRFA
jgi:hypothetical protein